MSPPFTPNRGASDPGKDPRGAKSQENGSGLMSTPGKGHHPLIPQTVFSCHSDLKHIVTLAKKSHFFFFFGNDLFKIILSGGKNLLYIILQNNL